MAKFDSIKDGSISDLGDTMSEISLNEDQGSDIQPTLRFSAYPYQQPSYHPNSSWHQQPPLPYDHHHSQSFSEYGRPPPSPAHVGPPFFGQFKLCSTVHWFYEYVII